MTNPDKDIPLGVRAGANDFDFPISEEMYQAWVAKAKAERKPKQKNSPITRENFQDEWLHLKWVKD